jgi:hypothetical protein
MIELDGSQIGLERLRLLLRSARPKQRDGQTGFAGSKLFLFWWLLTKSNQKAMDIGPCPRSVRDERSVGPAPEFDATQPLASREAASHRLTAGDVEDNLIDYEAQSR